LASSVLARSLIGARPRGQRGVAIIIVHLRTSLLVHFFRRVIPSCHSFSPAETGHTKDVSTYFYLNGN
jgi:hypothetical protein